MINMNTFKNFSLLIILNILVSVNGKKDHTNSFFMGFLNSSAESWNVIKPHLHLIKDSSAELCSKLFCADKTTVIMNSLDKDVYCLMNDINIKIGKVERFLTIMNLMLLQEICLYRLRSFSSDDKLSTIVKTEFFYRNDWKIMMDLPINTENCYIPEVKLYNNKKTFLDICILREEPQKYKSLKSCFSDVYEGSTFHQHPDFEHCLFDESIEFKRNNISYLHHDYLGYHDNSLSKYPNTYNVYQDDTKNDKIKIDNYIIGTKKTHVNLEEVNLVFTNDPKDMNTYCCYKTNANGSLCLKLPSYSSFDYGELNLNRPYRRDKAIENCASGRCSGVNEFCLAFGCSEIEPYRCELDQYYKKISILSDGNPIHVGTVDFKTRELFVKNNIKELSLRTCDDCVFNCKDGHVNALSGVNKFKFIKYCKFPICSTFDDLDTKKFTSKLSKSASIHEGIMTIQYKIIGMVDFEEVKIFCDKMELCSDLHISDIRDWIYPQCYKYWQWFIVVIILFTLILIISLFFKIFLRIIKYFTPIIRTTFCFLWKFLVICKKKICQKLFKIKTDIDSNYNEDYYDLPGIRLDSIIANARREIEREENNREIRNIIRPRPPAWAMSSFVLLTMLLISIEPSLTCSITESLSIENNQCVVTSTGNEVCSINLNTRISLSPVNEISCFMLKKNGKPIGSIQIKTVSIQLECLKDLLYYVPDFKHSCSSSYNCHSAGYCSSDYKECNNPSSYTEKIFGVKGGLFEHKCVQVPTSSECFYNSASCFHSLVKFGLKSSAYSTVFNCASWRYSVLLDITYSSITTSETKSITLYPGIRKTVFGMHLSLTSVSLPPSIVFNKCFLKTYSVFSIADCNSRSEMVKGKVGELRCPTVATVQNHDLAGCTKAENLVGIERHNQFLECTTNYISLEKIIKSNSLPSKVGDFVVSVDENERIFSDIHENSLMEININSGDVKLTSTTDMNSCSVRFKQIHGCYSCPQGAILSLEVKTNFGSAIGTVSCPQANLMFPMSVNNTAVIKNVSIHYDKSVIDGECFLTCPQGEEKFFIKGRLEYIPPIDIKSNETVSGLQIKNGSIDWLNVLKIPEFKWVSSIFLILVIIILLIMGWKFINFLLKKKIKSF